LKRGDVYTAATGGGYGGKPRPVLLIQSDVFRSAKQLVALIGSPVAGMEAVRVRVEPDESNGLIGISEVAVDTIVTVKPRQFGKRLGRLRDEDLRRVDRALMVFLGLDRGQ
jgi:mRNA interferase MazF